MDPATIVTETENLTSPTATYPLACEHVVTTYVIPNILHLVAFIMGFVHFRILENEHMYALMENVCCIFFTDFIEELTTFCIFFIYILKYCIRSMLQ